VDFFAGAFFAGAFLAGAFFTGAFFAEDFLTEAFFAGAFFAGAFFAFTVCVAAAESDAARAIPEAIGPNARAAATAITHTVFISPFPYKVHQTSFPPGLAGR
jgi:uncharacterized protein YjbI with pentapeptide repeats